MTKNWDKILREMSSPESSDAEDELNVVSVRKNARRVAELAHHMIPGAKECFRGAQPFGMNRSDVLRSEVQETLSSSLDAEEASVSKKSDVSPSPKDQDIVDDVATSAETLESEKKHDDTLYNAL